jgi:hypothetical protein
MTMRFAASRAAASWADNEIHRRRPILRDESAALRTVSFVATVHWRSRCRANYYVRCVMTRLQPRRGDYAVVARQRPEQMWGLRDRTLASFPNSTVKVDLDQQARRSPPVQPKIPKKKLVSLPPKKTPRLSHT